MIAQLTPLERCQEIAGLAPHEIVIGVSPSEKHERLLAKYRRARRSQTVARTKIVADLRAAVTSGATGEAADLLIVLRQLLSQGAPVTGPSHSSNHARRAGAALQFSARKPLCAPRAAPAIRATAADVIPSTPTEADLAFS